MDLESIRDVHSRSIRGLCAGHYGPVEIAAWTSFRTPESFRAVFITRVLVVAERDGAIVGFGQLDLMRGEVEAIYVAPEAAGAGVGSALLSRLEQTARESGASKLSLSASLNAELFYRRRGYHSLGPAKHRITPEVALDCLRMEKDLTP